MALKKIAENENELSSDEIRRRIEESKRLIAEQQKLKRRLSRKVASVVENESRAKEDRMKNHAGGMMRMTGLLDYIYQDTDLHDNNQDALIEYLLVGGLLRLSQQLSVLKPNDLHELYKKGKAFRDLKPDQREVPALNSELHQLFDILRTSKVNESSTKDCQNVHDNDVGQ